MDNSSDFKNTVQVYMPRPPYPSEKRQWVDIPELKKRLGGAYPIKVDPSFPYVRDVAMRVVQDQPDGGIWTSSLMSTTDGRYVTDWSVWCENNMPHWLSKGCALLSIKPNARIYTINGVEDYHRLRDMYPYPLFKRHGRQERLGHSVDWEAVAQDYDGVHNEKGMAEQVRSTIWLNPEKALTLMRVTKVLEYGIKGYDWEGKPERTYTISNVPKGLIEGTVDYNRNNYFRTSNPEYFRLYKSVSRSNPIPQAWGTAPIEFIGQDSLNENFDGEDLRDANLRGSNLSGSSFRNADLSGAVLCDCDLRNCDFTGANLDRASFAFASVEGAIFDECSMDTTLLFDPEDLLIVGEFNPSRIKISGYVIDASRESLNDTFAELRKSGDASLLAQYIELVQALAGDLGIIESSDSPYRFDVKPGLFTTRGQVIVYSFENINLDGSYRLEIKYTKFEGLNFEESSLRNIHFRDCFFTKCSFTNSDLESTRFYGSILRDCDFRDADLRDTHWEQTRDGDNERDTSCERVDFRGADLRDCIIYEAQYYECKFRYATFGRGSWQYFNLHGCDLRDIDLSEVNLEHYGYVLDAKETQEMFLGWICQNSKYNDKTRLFDLSPRAKEAIRKTMVYVP